MSSNLGFIKNSNFINNTLSTRLFNSENSIVFITNVSFFFNSNKQNFGDITFISCLSDISGLGITQTSFQLNAITYFPNNCSFNFITLSKKIKLNFIYYIFGVII